MRNWIASAVAVLLIVSAAPSIAQDSGATAADSLTWYVEQLERDLAQAEIMAADTRDSLQIRVEYLTTKLEWATEDRRRWYHDPRLWFPLGVALGVIVTGQVLRIGI